MSAARPERTRHAGSVPVYLRVTNEDLIAALKKQEMMGPVRLGAFAQRGQSSTSTIHSSSMDDDPPTSDPNIPAEELESIGTLAQLKGMTWSTQDNVEMVRRLRCTCICASIGLFRGFRLTAGRAAANHAVAVP